jgi:RNA polymerase sigma-70 factor (ECF subfamily)
MKLIQDCRPATVQYFNLYVVEGYTHKDIAAMMGISEGTSKSQLARCKSDIKNVITGKQKESNTK